MLVVAFGVLLLQCGIFAAGLAPLVLSRFKALAGADPEMFPIGFMTLQMVLIGMTVMVSDSPERFPMGRAVALAAMSTFLFAALFLVVGSLKSSPRRDAWLLALVALLVTFFGLTATGVAVAGGRIFIPAAALLLGLAGWLWWKLFLTIQRGPPDQGPP